MIVIPAIDLKGGACVRLHQGEAHNAKIYSDDPVAVAQGFVEEGARRIHVIDLDGAFSGGSRNFDWIARIKQRTEVVIQAGGGVRTIETIERMLDAGIDRVILGSVVFDTAGLAKTAFERFGERLMVALDVRDGEVAVHGWTESSGVPVPDAIEIIEKLGGTEIIYTDISRDGTLAGANVSGVERVMKATRMRVYASGGVTTLDDIRQLKAIGCPACVVGKALYEGAIDLASAMAAASSAG